MQTEKQIIETLNYYNELALKRGWEVWRSIDGYDNYDVSSKARVRNNKTDRILKQQKHNGYFMVRLYNHMKNKRYFIHRLVAIAFIPNLENQQCVDHIDNCRSNNTITNLRWASSQENQFNRTSNNNNTSGFKGVCFCKRSKKWLAHIKQNGKQFHIGYYNTLEDAKIARQLKANELFGEFTNACEK